MILTIRGFSPFSLSFFLALFSSSLCWLYFVLLLLARANDVFLHAGKMVIDCVVGGGRRSRSVHASP